MGFGREIKDFIGAFEAGKKIIGDSDDRAYKQLRNRVLKQKADQLDDPEYQKLTKNKLQAQIDRLKRGPRPRDPELTESRRLSNRLRALQIKNLENPPKEPSAADGVAPYAPPPSAAPSAAPGPQSALDVGQSFDTAQADMPEQDDFDETDDQPTTMAARGGAITLRGYAGGGAVEDDDSDLVADDTADDTADSADYMDAQDAADEDDGSDLDDAPAGALPVGRSAQPASTASAAAPSGKSVSYSPEAAHDAVKAGLLYANKELVGGKEGAVTVDMSARKAGVRKYASGAGAASHDEMVAVAKAIDPEGKMSENERNLASLATVYEWNLKNNNPEGADRAAASQLQYFRQVSDRYKALSAVAAQHGDLDGAMKMALRAHANVPDGKDMKLEKMPDGRIKYSLTDIQTGKVVEQTLATPDQMLEYASKGALHSFDDLLLRSAAGRAELAAKAKAGKKGAAGLKATDRDHVDTAISTAMTDLPEETAAAIKPQVPEIKGAAFQMQAANPGVSASDALRATMEMTQVSDPANPTAAPFKATGKTDDGVKITLSNGQSMVVPDELVARLRTVRTKNVEAAKKKLEAGKAAGARTQSNIDAAGAVLTPKPYGGAPAPLSLQGAEDTFKAPAPAQALPVRRAVDPARQLEMVNRARRARGQGPLTLEQLGGAL